jgi:hypothetical protein
MGRADERQHDGVAPLLEPAVIVVDNCEGCRGTGYRVSRAGGSDAPWDGRDPVATDVPNNTVPHEDCDGSGRVAREVPLSEFVEMAAGVTLRYQAPSPSEVRRGT